MMLKILIWLHIYLNAYIFIVINVLIVFAFAKLLMWELKIFILTKSSCKASTIKNFVYKLYLLSLSKAVHLCSPFRNFCKKSGNIKHSLLIILRKIMIWFVVCHNSVSVKLYLPILHKSFYIFNKLLLELIQIQ